MGVVKAWFTEITHRWCELLLVILSLYNQFNQHQVLACLPTLSATSHVSPMAIDVTDLHVVSLINRQSLFLSLLAIDKWSCNMAYLAYCEPSKSDHGMTLETRRPAKES